MLRFSDCITEVKANSLIKSSPITQMVLLKVKPFTAYYEIKLSTPGVDLGFLEGGFH